MVAGTKEINDTRTLDMDWFKKAKYIIPALVDLLDDEILFQLPKCLRWLDIAFEEEWKVTEGQETLVPTALEVPKGAKFRPLGRNGFPRDCCKRHNFVPTPGEWQRTFLKSDRPYDQILDTIPFGLGANKRAMAVQQCRQWIGFTKFSKNLLA